MFRQSKGSLSDDVSRPQGRRSNTSQNAGRDILGGRVALQLELYRSCGPSGGGCVRGFARRYTRVLVILDFTFT